MSKTKLKTHKGASKRFKITGSGKVKRSRASGNHLLTKKTSRRKRALKKAAMVHESNEKNVKKLIPYG